MISINNAEKYTWGPGCSGWHLVKKKDLGIIQEMMPPGTQEEFHFHHNAQQFFFILRGEATFYSENKIEIIKPYEGIYVRAGIIHKIKNNSGHNLEFLVISQPHAHGDRENI